MSYRDPEKYKEWCQKHKNYFKEYSKKYRDKNQRKLQEKDKEYYLKNKEKIKLRKKIYYQNHKEEIKEISRQYRENNKEKVLQYDRDYYQQNKEKRYKQRILKYNSNYYEQWRKDNSDKIKEYRKVWRSKLKKNKKYNLRQKISRGIHEALRKNKKGRHWETLVGYTLKDLQNHLKKTMPKDYTWQDFMEGKLHIDHIIPISVFNYTNPEHVDFRRCWALENLQLLPAKENLRKKNKLYKPFQPALRI